MVVLGGKGIEVLSELIVDPSLGHVGFQNAGFKLGLALGAHKPAKMSQSKVTFSHGSLKILIPS